MPRHRRLFFALYPDPALRPAIVAAAQNAALAAGVSGKRTHPERLHLTVYFLGELDAAAEAFAWQAAERVRVAPFELTLDRAGSFGHSQVLWLAPSIVPAGLRELHDRLREGVDGLGDHVNRKALKPHVTCYRHIDRPLKETAVPPIRWPVREFCLVHSELGAEPRYHVVSQWPLENASR